MLILGFDGDVLNFKIPLVESVTTTEQNIIFSSTEISRCDEQRILDRLGFSNQSKIDAFISQTYIHFAINSEVEVFNEHFYNISASVGYRSKIDAKTVNFYTQSF